MAEAKAIGERRGWGRGGEQKADRVACCEIMEVEGWRMEEDEDGEDELGEEEIEVKQAKYTTSGLLDFKGLVSS